MFYFRRLEVRFDHKIFSKMNLIIKFCRSHEHIGLTVFHILFLREHNRLAKILHTLNPHWDDERLFQVKISKWNRITGCNFYKINQEARRINIAVYQRIVYEEFLPKLLGPDLMEHYLLEFLETNHQPYVSHIFLNIKIMNHHHIL